MKLKADGVAAKERHDSRVHLIAPLPSLMYCSQGIDKIYLRGDSALYEHDLMRWLDDRRSAMPSRPV